MSQYLVYHRCSLGGRTTQKPLKKSSCQVPSAHKPRSSSKRRQSVGQPVHYVLLQGTGRLCSRFWLISPIRTVSNRMLTNLQWHFSVAQGQYWYPTFNEARPVTFHAIWNYPLSSNGLTLYSLYKTNVKKSFLKSEVLKWKYASLFGPTYRNKQLLFPLNPQNPLYNPREREHECLLISHYP
jgi:hypothetical protein